MSSTSPVIETPVKGGNSADLDIDIDLDDLLGPPPQRFSGGGTNTATQQRSPGGGTSQGRGGGWNEHEGSQSRGGGGYGDEFGSARGAFASDVNAAREKAVRGNRLITHVDVGEDGACPVTERDVDPRSVAALLARGIEKFTPVQVSHPRSRDRVRADDSRGTSLMSEFGLHISLGTDARFH